MFPTFDHGLLPKLYDMFFETLLEFEAECQCYPWFFETIKGQFQQLSRTEPMPYDSHERYLRKIKSKMNWIETRFRWTIYKSPPPHFDMALYFYH